MKLSVVQDLWQAIADEELRLESLRACERIVAPALEYLPPMSAATDSIAQFAVQVKESESRLEKLRDEYSTATAQLANEIGRRVHGAARDVLIRRYCYGKRFGKIASELNYSVANIYRLHRRGKQEYERI